MPGWRVTISAAALIATTAAALAAQTPSPRDAGAPQEPGARFRSAVDIVSVAAVVRDRKGRFVSDLSQRDFVVIEAGQPRPIINFKAEDDGPVKLAIVFDVSGSMRVGGKAEEAREVARQMLSTLKGSDQAALYSFDTRLQQVRGFTSDFNALMAALGDVDVPYGQTSLYDAVAETARSVVAAAGPAPGGAATQRSAVVVLTDGIDTHSRLKPEEVSGIASEIDVPVYVVAVMSTVDNERMFDDPEVGAVGGLRDLARWTGGDLFTTMAPAQTSIAARQIVSELRHQYLLAFEASPRPGWRSLEVKARNRELVVRARSGYTAGGRASMESAGKPR